MDGPLIGQVVAAFVPHQGEAVWYVIVLVDGALCLTWDWRHIPDLYSAQTGYPGA
jgi:hypothetical protein